MNTTYQPEHEETLDPENWDLARDLGHRMIDDLIDYWQTVRERPVWQRPPAEVKERFHEPLPEEPQGMQQAYQDFQDLVLPYPKGIFTRASGVGSMAPAPCSALSRKCWRRA